MTGSFKLPVITFGDALSQAWLAARGLDAFVNKEERMDLPQPQLQQPVALLQALPPHAGVVSHAPDANIRTAFHGTWWYALWGLLRSGRVLESNDETKGHKFWHPGAGRESVRERANCAFLPRAAQEPGVFERRWSPRVLTAAGGAEPLGLLEAARSRGPNARARGSRLRTAQSPMARGRR